MRNKSIIAILLIAVLVGAGLIVHQVAFAKEAPAYRFVSVSRGDLQSTVSATGTLGAVTTVSIGTQVSGQVQELLVDYNDHVKKGQLLARIDPTLAQQGVIDAQANVEKAQAQLVQMQRDYSRNRELSGAGLIARSALDQAQSSFEVARASVKSAQVSYDRAKQNLAYTSIYAPIDGVVVERNVQQGQTVAASLSAPQLFLIANDLAHMQILAQVGESDIAQIKEGQPVKFTVQALQGQTFNGKVQQVRLQSQTQENVVNYTVVIAVDNAQNKLLPGMTARVEFQTKAAENVLKVPNAALRFHPAVAPAAAAKTTTATTSAQTDPSATPRTRTGNRTGGGTGTRPSFGTLYYLDAKGAMQAARVRTGLTDGTTTEISSKDITEGMKVISGMQTAQSASADAKAASPFQGGQQPQGGGARGGAF